MVGRFQPYLYTEPVDNSGFNPKAVTMASRLPPPPPKKKQEGPLIDFNRHPDSYLILPYGNRDVKPMSTRTKTYIKIARWIQLAFRVVTLLGAVGVLLCGIFIRGAADTEGYIMRIPVRPSHYSTCNIANLRSLALTSLCASTLSTTSSATQNRDPQPAQQATTSSRWSPMPASYHSTSSLF